MSASVYDWRAGVQISPTDLSEKIPARALQQCIARLRFEKSNCAQVVGFADNGMAVYAVVVARGPGTQEIVDAVNAVMDNWDKKREHAKEA